jgi:hypothetical protein
MKFVVPTPHNTLLIMWGRDKNFQVSSIYEMRNCKNKISLGQVLFYSPFNYHNKIGNHIISLTNNNLIFGFIWNQYNLILQNSKFQVKPLLQNIIKNILLVTYTKERLNACEIKKNQCLKIYCQALFENV